MVPLNELDRNELLFPLPLELRQKLADRMEPVSLTDGEIFREVGARCSEIVFPIS
jgi:hypothetical protein